MNLFNKEPLASFTKMRRPIFVHPRLPSCLAITESDNSLASPNAPLWIVAQRRNSLSFRRVDVAVHAIRAPFLECESLCFKDDLAGFARRFITKDGTVVASLAVHSLVVVRPYPTKQHSSFCVSQNKFAARIQELPSSDRAPGVVAISQHRHLAVKMCRSYQASGHRKQHGRRF